MSGSELPYLTIGNISIDREGRQVYCCGRTIELSCLHFNLLIYLFDHTNKVCVYDELLAHVWNYAPDTGDVYIVRLAISRLRRSFQRCPHCQGRALQIRTVRQIGYCLHTRKSW